MTAARRFRSIGAMADSPRITPVKANEQAARKARLARALRDNLRRRKEQARARAIPAGAGPKKRGERQ